MAWHGQHAQGPWDFFHDPSNGAGFGVDHAGPQFPQGHPFAAGGFGPWGNRGGWGWGGGFGGRGGWGRHHGGRHGRRGRRDGDEEPPTDGEQGTAEEDTLMVSENEKPVNEKGDSPATARNTPNEHPDPPESVPQPPPFFRHSRHGHHGFRGRDRCGGRGGGMRGHHHGGPHPHGPHPHGGPHHHRHHGPPPPHFGGPGGPGFPWNMMNAFAQSPWGQNVRDYLERAQDGNDANNNDINNINDDVESFTPPVDVFHAPEGWVLHIAVPGAKKEDVGVNWDGDKRLLSVSGVVYRPGDEEFLQGLVSGERKVGLFSRDVKLPPPGAEGGEKDEVNAEGITARMEDGILIVSVPVVEKEWTEVKKVDIL